MGKKKSGKKNQGGRSKGKSNKKKGGAQGHGNSNHPGDKHTDTPLSPASVIPGQDELVASKPMPPTPLTKDVVRPEKTKKEPQIDIIATTEKEPKDESVPESSKAETGVDDIGAASDPADNAVNTSGEPSKQDEPLSAAESRQDVSEPAAPPVTAEPVDSEIVEHKEEAEPPEAVPEALPVPRVVTPKVALGDNQEANNDTEASLHPETSPTKPSNGETQNPQAEAKAAPEEPPSAGDLSLDEPSAQEAEEGQERCDCSGCVIL